MPALHQATLHNDVEATRNLLSGGAVEVDQNDNGFTPLRLAAQQGRTEIVRLLLEHGANPNWQNPSDGIGPLYEAAMKGHTEIVRLLLGAGANPSVKDEEGVSPLLVAAENGHEEVIGLLTEHTDVKGHSNKADIQDNTKTTPLFMAAQNNHPEAVRRLLEAGAEPNIQDDKGMTPLHMAAHYGYTQVVRLLLASGANPNRTSNRGTTPIDAATRAGHHDILLLFSEAQQAHQQLKETSTMPNDIEAINSLSERFVKNVEKEHRMPSTGTIVLLEDDDLIEEGEKVLRLYEAEQARYPDDPNVRTGLALHLYRMGLLYYQSVVPQFLNNEDSPTGLGSDEAAHRACIYMHRSYHILPQPGAAFTIGYLFETAEFYATAIHWYEQAEHATGVFKDIPTVKDAQAKKLSLKADDNTGDPDFDEFEGFPQEDTPGLLPETLKEYKRREVETAAANAERARRDAERRQQEAQATAERERRLRERLCLKCGKPLGFMEKMTGRQEHKIC